MQKIMNIRRKKYTGLYSFYGIMEDYECAQNDIKQLIERLEVEKVLTKHKSVCIHKVGKYVLQ